MRPLKWAQLARRVPPSAINRNISDVLRIYAPEAMVPQPCERQLQKMRTELTVAGEAIAAFRVAKSGRIISFGFDESTKWGTGLLSTNIQIEPHNAPGTSVDVVMRGATITAGGTSEEIARSIEVNLFQHGRRLLVEWKSWHEKRFGAGSWAAAGAPDPECVGIHRLSEETLIMSDTCNGARKCKRLVAELAEAAGKDKIGAVAWEAMSEAERAKVCKAYIGDCHQHLRNIVITAMAKEATSYLSDQLQDTLADFSAFDRMSADGMDLIRAAHKEFHPAGEYALGKGRESEALRKLNFPSELWLPLEAIQGSRMDLAFSGAVPLFWNRKIMLHFLHGLASVPGHENRLEKFLYRVMSCNEMTALLRTCTLFKLAIFEPMRWLTGKAGVMEDWSIVNSSGVLDDLEKALVAIAADGHTLLDPSLDPLAEIAKAQPAFAKWRVDCALEKKVSPDGKPHPWRSIVLAEARSPRDAEGGNHQAKEMVVALAEKMANAALVAMRDPKRALADKLVSLEGVNAADRNEAMHEATIGAHVMNDYVESNFGTYDYVSRTFRGTSVENLSGMSQQMRNHDFDLPENVAHDRRHAKQREGEAPKQAGGFFYTGLTVSLQESLVEYSRHAAEDARRDGRAALAAHDAAKLARREERLQTLLNAAVDHYARAKELFNMWQGEEGRPSQRAKNAGLHPIPPHPIPPHPTPSQVTSTVS